MNDTGCPFRKWGWHDGGPNYTCEKAGKNQGHDCKDNYSDYYFDAETCEVRCEE